jgi:hypothetical protein
MSVPTIDSKEVNNLYFLRRNLEHDSVDRFELTRNSVPIKSFLFAMIQWSDAADGKSPFYAGRIQSN